MMLAKFRHLYPQGSLVSELVKIDRGTYIVKATIELDRLVLTTALASGATVEAAEDAAKERAIASLYLAEAADNTTAPLPYAPKQNKPNPPQSPPSNQPEIASPINLSATVPPSNNQIVNFSKPQSEPVENIVEPKPAAGAETNNSGVKQLNLDPVPESAPEPSGNLFADTLVAPEPNPELSTSDRSDHNPVSQSPAESELAAMDFNEIKQKTDIEIKRLGWTKEQGRDFLMSRYGKRSRLHLKDEQLTEFLRYLENLPTPVK